MGLFSTVTVLGMPSLNRPEDCIGAHEVADIDGVAQVDAVVLRSCLYKCVRRVTYNGHILRRRASRQYPAKHGKGEAHQERLHDNLDHLAALLFPAVVVVLTLAPVLVGVVVFHNLVDFVVVT